MLTQTLKKIFTRDLNKLKAEIELYQNEEKIWYVEKILQTQPAIFACT